MEMNDLEESAMVNLESSDKSSDLEEAAINATLKAEIDKINQSLSKINTALNKVNEFNNMLLEYW